MYQTLADYLPEIESDSFGKWIIDKDNKGTPENPIQMPYVSFSDMVKHFEKDVYNFQFEHPEYELNRYSDILRENGIEWGTKSMQEADVSALDGKMYYGIDFRCYQVGTVLQWSVTLLFSKWSDCKMAVKIERNRQLNGISLDPCGWGCFLFILTCCEHFVRILLVKLQ